MKIIGLKAENVKNIKAIEIQADGKTVILSGKNEVGKSSVIDSIMMALTGKMVERPIKDGEERAEVNIDLGEYKVKRIWTEKTNRLEVASKEGAKYPSPQTLLDKIIGQLCFDPLAFKSMEEKAQRSLLMRLVGLDFTSQDLKRKNTYDERTIQNRLLDNAKANLSRITNPGEVPQPIDTPKLMQNLESLYAQQRSHEAYTRRKKELEDLFYANLHEIETLEKKTNVLREANDSINSQLTSLVEPANISNDVIEKIKNEIKTADEINTKIKAKKAYIDLTEEHDKILAKAESLTKEITAIDSEKQTAFLNAKYPIEGLAVTEDCVTYKGLPFSQLSEGMKIRVSTAMAMQMNPNLKVILIKEGSLLDSEALAAVIEMAKEKDYQLWIEKVSDDKEIKIQIED